MRNNDAADGHDDNDAEAYVWYNVSRHYLVLRCFLSNVTCFPF